MKQQEELNEAELEQPAGGYDPDLVRWYALVTNSVRGSYDIEDNLML